jgi:hypothetical protein
LERAKEQQIASTTELRSCEDVQYHVQGPERNKEKVYERCCLGP